jgi:hypothetical protein
MNNRRERARLRDAGAQQAERTRRYVSIASTAGAQVGERNKLFMGSMTKERN